MTEFVQVQLLTVNEGESQALEYLSQSQMCVLFGQMHQVKVLDCLESETKDFDSDGESEDEEGGYNSKYNGDMTNLTMTPAMNFGMNRGLPTDPPDLSRSDQNWSDLIRIHSEFF